MESGIVSVRYARALIKVSLVSFQEEQVYTEMITLVNNLSHIPQLRRIIENPMVSITEKTELVISACGIETSKLTQKFISLILQEGREKDILSIATSYIKLYQQHKNIIKGKLTTAVPISQETKNKFSSKIKERTNGIVELCTDINPDIIGGFVLEYDTYSMDASMKKKLNFIETELKK